ncbi:30S ribosomal protein S19 [Patescibacteria group bacterium]|nr:30S ribosomal protein S19 [Patescibacteria group bacterium]
MSRSLKKGPYINERLLNKIKALKPGDATVINTWDRSCTITPEMIGFKIGVHNGRKHVEVLIDEDKVGYKLGQFSITRKFVSHGGRMVKKGK